MTVDRILQLKLVTDVGNINAQMSGVEKSVGNVSRAFSTLKSFAVPALASVGLSIGSNITDALTDSIAQAGLLREELIALDSLTVAIGLDDANARAVLESLTAEAQTLGFGDEVGIADAFTRALAVTEDVEASIALVRASFDQARASGDTLADAVDTTFDAIIGGGDEAEEKLGVFGETFDERMTAFNQKYGDFAETFALTDEGQWEAINAKFEGHMLDLGMLIDGWVLDTKSALVGMFEDWEFIFEEGPRIIGAALDQMADRVGQGFAALRRLVLGAVNAIVGAWNTLDPAIDISIHEGFEFLGKRVGLDGRDPAR